MSLPLYQGVQAPSKALPDMHLGLWFERFFAGYAPDFSEVSIENRKEWLSKTARNEHGDIYQLQDKALQLRLLTLARNGEAKIFRTTGQFVTGLGNPHPLENGFLWHPTLGTPYLPGSAVKGLVRALVETAYEGEDKAQRLTHWFGTENKDDISEQSGSFIFMDALPVKPCDLKVEIMTPHMGDWYAKGDQAKTAQQLPGDWHEPKPVSYLVARNLSLQFIILPRKPDDAAELGAIWQALEYALDWLGAGAKTAIGFGHFVADDSEESKLQKRAIEQQQEQQVQQQRSNASVVGLAVIDFTQKFAGMPAGLGGGDAQVVQAFQAIETLIELAQAEGSADEKQQAQQQIKAFMAEKQLKPSKKNEKAFKRQLASLLD